MLQGRNIGRGPFQESEIGEIKLIQKPNGEIVLKEPSELRLSFSDSESEIEPKSENSESKNFILELKSSSEELDQDLPIKSNPKWNKLNEQQKKTLDLHLSFSDDEIEPPKDKSFQIKVTKKRVRFSIGEDYLGDEKSKSHYTEEILKSSYFNYLEKLKYENSKKRKLEQFPER